jgi:hypothetical protein
MKGLLLAALLSLACAEVRPSWALSKQFVTPQREVLSLDTTVDQLLQFWPNAPVPLVSSPTSPDLMDPSLDGAPLPPHGSLSLTPKPSSRTSKT